MQTKLIAHRDLKPSNFLLSTDYKCFKLNDFSEATYTNESFLVVDTYAGTKTYMAPELYNNFI